MPTDKITAQKLPIPTSLTYLNSACHIKAAIAKIKEDCSDVPNECINVSIKSNSYKQNTLSEISSFPILPPKLIFTCISEAPKLDKKSSYVNIFYSILPSFYCGDLFIEQGYKNIVKVIATLDSRMLMINYKKDTRKYPLEYYYAQLDANPRIINKEHYYPLVLTSIQLESVYLYASSKSEQSKWFTLINKATSRIILEHKYLLGDIIGSGSYGIVHLAKNKFTDQNVAIKIIRKKDIKHEAQLKKEIDILKICKHPNIVKLIEVIESSHSIALVMEYLSGGSLESCGSTFFDTARVRDIMDSLTSALFYLKELGIIHRDIKRDNIIFVSNHLSTSDIKIVDFGLTSICYPEAKLKGSVGTASYISPEQILSEKYNFKTDIWSLGVVFYFLLCGRLPFIGVDILSVILNKEPKYESILSVRGQAALDLVAKMLNKEPSERISIEKVRMHPFFQRRNTQRKDSLLIFKMFSSSMHNLNEHKI
jgi:tRNA A-37 threonylcarbamoyl transferase component Bud32